MSGLNIQSYLISLEMQIETSCLNQTCISVMRCQNSFEAFPILDPFFQRELKSSRRGISQKDVIYAFLSYYINFMQEYPSSWRTNFRTTSLLVFDEKVRINNIFQQTAFCSESCYFAAMQCFTFIKRGRALRKLDVWWNSTNRSLFSGQ